MRILQVNKFLYPKGGAEVVCLGLTEMLRAEGHEVFHFGMADARNLETADADCHPGGVDYHASRGLSQKTGEALRMLWNREARQGMARLLDRRKPDIIHAHNIYHQLTPSIFGPARKRGIPVLLTLHDYKLLCPVYTFLRGSEVCEECRIKGGPEPILAHRCKGGLGESLTLWAEDRLHRMLGSYEKGVALFTSPSRFLREKMITGRLAPGRIDHLPNFLPFPEEILDRPYQAPPSGTPSLLWVGRMSGEKGLETLLEALRRVKAPLVLRLAGDGPLEPRLRARAAELGLGDRVEFLGRVPRERVPELVLESGGTILPSEWYENAPMAILESLALGRPVLASRMGGVPEMIRENETGWLFPPADIEALASLMERWAEGLAADTSRGRRAWEDARERFHPRVVLATLLELYGRLAGK